MSEDFDTGHGHLAAAGEEAREFDQASAVLAEAHAGIAEVQAEEREIEYEHVHHVEYDDGYGGHYELTDVTVFHEQDSEVDTVRAVEDPDGQLHADLAELEAEEREIGYEHIHRVEYDDGYGGHYEVTDITVFHQEGTEIEAVPRVSHGGHGGVEYGGHDGYAEEPPAEIDGRDLDGRDLDGRDLDGRDLDGRDLDAFFGRGHGSEYGFGDQRTGHGHLGRAGDTDSWVSN
jgi:hypothetical protein